ncbi:MAG TPA: sigma-70 family RNA polymerase sigma factor [Tepidisphaeraceae bacterium]|nr:sigma-70 family RNA polymerase sigma factor [Tepidisphaeraceae bacterium]
MSDEPTTVVVQRYLNELAGVSGETPAEPIVRQLLGESVSRLQMLCTTLLMRRYPRLTHPPTNLQPDELLSSVVERMLKAMRSVRPTNVRQFFALANQHMRWELNDLARRLDRQASAQLVRDSMVAAPPASSSSQLSQNATRILEVIESLPAEEREAFDMVRIQGMSQLDAAAVLGVSPKTVQRRVNRALLFLSERLGDLQSQPTA